QEKGHGMRLYLLRTGTIRAINAPVPVYLIRTADGDILVDTGYAPVPGGRITVAPEEELLGQLKALGVDPGQITQVECTHLDPDHCGNHHAFPAATFVIQRTHYELATSGTLARVEECRENWDLPADRYLLVDGDTELRPGIKLVATDGHVAGHQSVLVR